MLEGEERRKGREEGESTRPLALHPGASIPPRTIKQMLR
jgi:hypothetical protein